MTGAKIAIGGKGGVGKTSICAGLARLFAEDGYDVLAIDADPSLGLPSAFGLPVERRPKALVDMKDLVAQRVGRGKDAVGTYFRLNPQVADLPQEFWVKVGGVKLLVLGAITQAGAGCACPEAAFLRAVLTHTILHRRELVLVDLAAGVEPMGRASIEGIDALVLVVEPSGRSIETANNMARMAGQLGVKRIFAVANKVIDAAQSETIGSQLDGVSLLGAISFHRAVQEADLARRSLPEADEGFMKDLHRLKEELAGAFP